MQELQAFNFNGVDVLDSRDVAKMIGKQHAHLMRDIAKYEMGISTDPNLDSLNFFVPSTYRDKKGEIRKCYLLTKQGCEFVANKMTGKKGNQFTAQYVTLFNKMKNYIEKDSYMIEDPILRAKKWIAEHEKQAKLEQENKAMKPKALFADSVATSKSTVLIGELAKILRGNGVDIGATRLFKWMREHGYLINRKGSDWNMPTQKAMNLGLFKIKETPIPHSDGSISINKTTKVTGKGQIYFLNKFEKIVDSLDRD